MILDDFQKDIINDFWKWILEHRENETYVEYDSKEDLGICVDFYDLEDFVDEHITDAENRLNATVFNGHVYFKAEDILGGYGFSMDDAWSLRPIELEE